MQPSQDPHLEHPEQPLNQPPSHPASQPPLAAQSSESLPPVDTTPTTTQATKKPRNSKRLFIALSIFVAVCILAVAAMLAVALLPSNTPKTTTTNPQSTKTVPQNNLTAGLAIDHVKEYFKGTKTAKNSITLPVQATGRDYFTIVPDTKPLASVAGDVAQEKAEAQLGSIIHSLEGDGFTKRVVSDGVGTSNYLADFTLPNTFCEVSVTKPSDAKADQWIEARCLDMSTYVEYATAQDPLVSLYTPLSATSVQYGFTGKPAPKDSKTAGYKTAELPVSIIVDNHTTSTGKYALYYQTPNGLWHYFADRDDTQAFDCNAYKTDDEKYAYAGTTCRNTAKGTTEVVVAPKKKS